MKRNIFTRKISIKLLFVAVVSFIVAFASAVLFASEIVYNYVSKTKNISEFVYNVIAVLVFGIGILVFVVCFLLFISRKIKYIRYISKRVGFIANEELGSEIKIQGNDEIAELCENINHMSRELKKKFDNERQMENAKNELITSVSHDLRTPLTSIIGYADLLRKKQYKDEQQYNEYVDTLYEKSENLRKLINELFEYTKLASPDVKLNISEVDIGKLLNQLTGEYMPIFEEEGLSIRRNIVAENINAWVDIERMVRVFDNIMINAKKYSIKPSEVTVSVKRNGHMTVISISNKTDEIPSQNLDRLFERFYREDKSRTDVTGSGLGLAIAKRIVELHDGRIWAEYKDNIITFNIELRIGE